MNENLLIENAKNGDRAALTELVKKYESTVYNFAFKMCRNRDKAENTMQETFLSMIKSIKSFGGQSKLSTWLYTIVSNHCLMLARKNSRMVYDTIDNEAFKFDEIRITDWKVNPMQVAENNELKVLLDNAIKKLSPDYRVVFLLRDVENLSNEETAQVLELSVPAVKSRLHRARAFLRNQLQGEYING